VNLYLDLDGVIIRAADTVAGVELAPSAGTSCAGRRRFIDHTGCRREIRMGNSAAS
jgi:hypothetical protein